MNNVILFSLALIPILVLIISLGVLKVPAYKACSMVLFITLVISVFFFKMPVMDAFTAALEGGVMAVWPIAVIIIAAMFTYNLALHTKSMDTIKAMLSSITTDRRIQVLILAWGFGGFLEAVAGYGTAVAIPASILAALGFDPIFAAVICLIANTVPTAFGAIGTPVISLAKIANLSINDLSYYVALQLVLFIVVIPLALVLMTTKNVKGLKGVVGISLASGLSFAVPQIIAARFMGAELPALIGSVCSMAVTIIIAKKMNSSKKKQNYLSMEEVAVTKNNISVKEGLMAWMPYILVFVFIILSSQLVPLVYNVLSHVKTSVIIYTGTNAKPYELKWIATPGTLIIIATVIGGLLQGAKLKEIGIVFVKTFKQMTKSTLTVIAIVAMAKVMDYSGMIKSIAEMLVAVTGNFYPMISCIIGALGTFVTGSDTSSNVLFGKLQTEVASSINVNPVWLAAANTTGATAGKMISPQSIAVATAATGLVGLEGKILNKTLKFCLGYVILLGILVYIGCLFIK